MNPKYSRLVRLVILSINIDINCAVFRIYGFPVREYVDGRRRLGPCSEEVAHFGNIFPVQV
jgi:hypothetical protein